jgi:hypothetical protein
VGRIKCGGGNGGEPVRSPLGWSRMTGCTSGCGDRSRTCFTHPNAAARPLSLMLANLVLYDLARKRVHSRRAAGRELTIQQPAAAPIEPHAAPFRLLFSCSDPP